MLSLPSLDSQSATPLYRQLFEALREAILAGRLAPGDRLPATRDLAAQLSLNRTTVSSAYELLESAGLISGHVGRGSFVLHPTTPPAEEEISFATSRPAEELFPLEDFHTTAETVIRSHSARILQLGSSYGYPPLREYLIEEAIQAGTFDPATDDLMLSSGCQQALDLLHRTLFSAGDTILTEEPVYPGLRNVFQEKLRPYSPARLREARALLVTPSFQNPTGHTMSLADREALCSELDMSGTLLIENDIYARLRYTGEALPAIRALLRNKANCILLGSFSKIAFPGLRVGWVIARKEIIERLAQTKQWTDLHSDQLSQAIMLEFARSGRLEAHLERIIAAGRERRAAILEALPTALPPGSTFTRPEGGMNLWVSLPAGCDSHALLERARREKVNYLPGRYFSIQQPLAECLRLSFAGLSPSRIHAGLDRLAPLFREEASRALWTGTPRADLAMV
jgi:2-aminoadipate transaminase